MLKSSHKNLRWEEGQYIYCHRYNLSLSFEEFFDMLGNHLKDDDKMFDEFEEICKDVRAYDVNSRNPDNDFLQRELKTLTEKEIQLLENKFGQT